MCEIVTIETLNLGDRSYLLTDGRVAAVIDPQRDIDRVLDLVEDRDLRVTHVFETHVHNDYVTGGYELSRRTGAAYHLHADDEVSFDRVGLTDGDEVEVGPLTIRAVHTPGHTPTHLSYVVRGCEGGEGPAAVFTGGSMLYGTVGRTDLVSRARTEELTRSQHRSVRHLAEVLPDPVSVHPTHGFGSFCSSQAATETDGSTIGREREDNLALTIDDQDAFVEHLLAGLDAYPRYYAHMAPRNRLGPEPVDLSPPAPADPDELLARIDAGEWVVDLRDRVAYAADHLAGTVNIELGQDLATYVGWLLPWGRPVTLVADTAGEVAEAQRQLVRIGIDRPAAAADGGVDAWAPDGPRHTYRVVDFEELATVGVDGGPVVLDVRRDGEWAEGAIRGAIHVPLHELDRHMEEVPSDEELWVHCASGFRASVAASLLERAGRTPVLIDDDFERAEELGLT